LDRLELQSFPKVSGSKGIQLYVPLNTKASYKVAQPFARTIAEVIEKQRPDLAVSVMPKAKRVGKVFIDWSQNADYKTTVAVYSLRAKRERPFVSMPVAWQEMELALKRQRADHLYFEPNQALRRLDDLGDLFGPVLESKQTIPAQFADAIGRHNQADVPNPLHDYDRKRGVPGTTEPFPRRSAQGGQRRFVIQKHAASHLHTISGWKWEAY
jgi:DNA primase